MKKEWADKWVEALRSGEYEQDRENLRSMLGYCCLGVLCDISKAGQWEGDHYQCDRQGDECDGYLPRGVRQVTGVQSAAGAIFSREGLTSLASMNDDGATFEEIADTIENRWEEL